jgi:hypothetical protein
MGFEAPSMDQKAEAAGEIYSPKTGDQVYVDGMKDEAPAEVVGVGKDGKVIIKRPDQSTVEVDRGRLEPANAEAGSVDLLSDEDVERDIA